MTQVDALIAKINQFIISPIVYLLATFAVLYFLYGMFQFMRKSEDKAGRKDGAQHMLWGVVGLTIIFSVRGIIAVLTSIWR